MTTQQISGQDSVLPGRDRSGQAAAFDAIGSRYDDAFPHKDGQLAAVEMLLTRLPVGSRVLDIGCGTGLPTARRLSEGGLRVTGVDLSEGMLEIARREVPAAEFHRMDLMDLGTLRAAHWGSPELGPEVLGRFDAVAAFFSLLLLPRAEIPTALHIVRALLRPGGLFALAMVEADLDDLPIPFLGSEIRVSGYLREELRGIVEAAGFTVEEQTSYAYAPASTEAAPEEQLFLLCRHTPGAAGE